MNSSQRRFVIAAIMISGLSFAAEEAVPAVPAAAPVAAPVATSEPAAVTASEAPAAAAAVETAPPSEPQCPEELVVEEAVPVVVTEEQTWVVGAAACCEDTDDWSFDVTDDGFVALPFALPGNILSVTGTTIAYIGRTPGAMMGSNKLLALPKAACTIGVQLPTGLTGKIVQAFGRGFQAIGRGFAQGVTALVTPPATPAVPAEVAVPVVVPVAVPCPAGPACTSEADK